MNSEPPIYSDTLLETRCYHSRDVGWLPYVRLSCLTEFRVICHLGDIEDPELQTLAKNMKSVRSGLEPALNREKLIGNAAIEIDAEHFIGNAPTTLADLKGKMDLCLATLLIRESILFLPRFDPLLHFIIGDDVSSI